MRDGPELVRAACLRPGAVPGRPSSRDETISLASRCVFALVLIALWSMNAVYTLRQPIWGPRDEIAHYDYIDRLSDGSLPDPRNNISAYTLAISSRFFTWLGQERFDGSARSMRIAGKSYEAEQPPLYYAILAIPNWVLKRVASPPLQVRILRTISLSFVAVAAALLFLAAEHLMRSQSGVALCAYLAALVLSSSNIASYATLGNDSLSALCGAITFLLLVFALEAPDRDMPAATLSLCVALSVVLVKLTNLVLLPAPIALLALRPRAPDRDARFRRLDWSVAPLLLIPLYLGVRSVRESGVGSFAARRYFASWVPGIASTPEFLRTLLSQTIDLAHLNLSPSPSAALVLALLLAFGLVDLLFAADRSGTRSRQIPAIALAVSLFTLATASALNRWFQGVHWHEFRHYAAALPFLAVGCSCFLERFPARARPAILLSFSLVGFVGLIRLVALLF